MAASTRPTAALLGVNAARRRQVGRRFRVDSSSGTECECFRATAVSAALASLADRSRGGSAVRGAAGRGWRRPLAPQRHCLESTRRARRQVGRRFRVDSSSGTVGSPKLLSLHRSRGGSAVPGAAGRGWRRPLAPQRHCLESTRRGVGRWGAVSALTPAVAQSERRNCFRATAVSAGVKRRLCGTP